MNFTISHSKEHPPNTKEFNFNYIFYFPLHFLLQRIHESDFKASKNDAPHSYKTNSHVDAEHERTHLKNNKLYDTKIPEKHFQKTKEKGMYISTNIY